jgi:diacylglycerol kinase (ATP)
MIVNAHDEKFNVWDITWHFRESGDVFSWNSKNKSKESLGVKTFHRLMSNYFSIGVESRIGLGFEKKRTKSRISNKIRYGIEGIKKMCCTKTNKLNTVMKSLTQLKLDGSERNILSTNIETPSENLIRNQDSIHKYFLGGNPVSLICTNINSMMGGQHNMWENGRKNTLGLSGLNGKPMSKKEMTFNDQSQHDDGILEFMTIPSVCMLSLGKPNRIAQDKGPFTIHFNEPTAKGGVISTYFQIDGEYYKVVNPEKVTIKLSDQFGSIRLLKHVEED